MQAQPPFVPVKAESYKDEDLVYVDPDTRTVVGLVEWSNSGKPKPCPMKTEEVDDEEGEERRRRRRQRFYPWGTYRSMKKVYKIEGKVRDNKDENRKTLDEAMALALKEPFWD